MIRNDQLIKVNDIEPLIYDKIRGGDLRDYLMRKNKWTPTIIESINWNGLEKVLTNMVFHRRLTLLQLIHNWQNVGSQKQRFLESAEPSLPKEMSQTGELRRQYQNQVGKYPFQCGLKEDALHFIHCSSIKAFNGQAQLIKKIRANLTRYDTHPTIISLLIYGLIGNRTCLPVPVLGFNALL